MKAGKTLNTLIYIELDEPELVITTTVEETMAITSAQPKTLLPTPEKLKVRNHGSIGRADSKKLTIVTASENLSPRSKEKLTENLQFEGNRTLEPSTTEENIYLSPGKGRYFLQASFDVVDVYVRLADDEKAPRCSVTQTKIAKPVSLNTKVTERADYDPNNPYLQSVTLIPGKTTLHTGRRKTSQNDAMGVSANEAAKYEGLDEECEWGHVIQYPILGEAGQVPQNLLLMPKHMNTWMKETVEDACRDLFEKKNKIQITTYPILKPSRKYAIAEKLVYNVVINDNISFTLVYQPPYAQKPAKQKVTRFMQKLINVAAALGEQQTTPAVSLFITTVQAPAQDRHPEISKPNANSAFNFFAKRKTENKKQKSDEEQIGTPEESLGALSDEDAAWLISHDKPENSKEELIGEFGERLGEISDENIAWLRCNT